MKITIPDPSLVLLIGPSGCGKSTFAHRHFSPTEVLSSDYFRSLVCDDEANQAASRDAFEVLHEVTARRLRWQRLTVIDATNTQADSRKPLLQLARRYHFLISAIVFDLNEATCQRQNLLRAERTVPSYVISNHFRQLQDTLCALEVEGIGRIWRLRSTEEVDNVTIQRVPLWVDRRGERGLFDLIGDVHGWIDELLALQRLRG